ncbi:alpha/beta hydrolase [Pseudonocardia sp. ICBG1122]|nr:alpha/beta hydrolase [Pseudonocardia pini]
MTSQLPPGGPTRPVDTVRGTAVSRDGTPVAWVRTGGGPPLVVCHGSFAAARDWVPFAAALSTDHTVYLYDRRGRDRTPAVVPDPAVDAELDDLDAVLSVAGADAAVLGHSFGGGCVLAAAARRRRTAPVVVYEPRHAVDRPIGGTRIPGIERLLAAGDRDAAVHRALADVVGLDDAAVASLAASPLWGRMRDTVGAFPGELRLLDTLRWRPGDLDGVRGPAWLLVGETSPVLPADREGALHSVLPGLRKVMLPGQDHFAYLSDPGLLAETVRRCLSGR